MTSLLVANRGEIARRIIRTARRMSLRTIAVYSDADAGEPFVREADVAVRLGPAPAAESYLSVARVLAAARETGAELVHPGYGFLAEDAAFARAVVSAGLVFVGPPAEVLAAVGSKAAARRLAEGAGVPVLPGYAGDDQRDAALRDAASAIGYPLVVKPSGGGGGKGMQVVWSEEQLAEALAAARRLATASFGDARILLERYLAAPRHLEVQLLADGHGEVRAFGERDCSAQRRWQKVLEETPAPGLDRGTRARLHAAAIALGRAAGYVNAGTAEFLVDERGRFFFIEVNARLQVEHPVTEEVFGVDLVEQQLRVALGERLGLPALEPRGHAIEARLYAEDARASFLPSTGTVLHARWPEGVRVDTGIEEGSDVTRFYDPLLAKIVARSESRDGALALLGAALGTTEVLGLRTNLELLRALVAHPALRAGTVTTDLLERDLVGRVPPAEPPARARALAAAAVVERALAEGSPRDPWRALGGWRHGGRAPAVVLLRDEGGEELVEVAGAGPFSARAHLLARDGAEAHSWSVDGEPAAAAVDRSQAWVQVGGAAHAFETGPRERIAEVAAAAEVVAPMPGVVVRVAARSGQHVRRGDALVVVEAMKMELRVEAPADGTVRAVLCREGEQVERGQRLIEFEPAAS